MRLMRAAVDWNRYSADNGGTDRGSNWPLRGSKHSNWEGNWHRYHANPIAGTCARELSICLFAWLLWLVWWRWLLLCSATGGMRAAAFVSGGLIPPPLRGTESHVVMHIADWYHIISVTQHHPELTWIY